MSTPRLLTCPASALPFAVSNVPARCSDPCMADVDTGRPRLCLIWLWRQAMQRVLLYVGDAHVSTISRLLTGTRPKCMIWQAKTSKEGRAMPRKNHLHAVAYYRTSSAGNVGADKDSEKRQRDAVHAYAKANGFEIVQEYYDAAVSGSDPIDQRDGFCAMLSYMLGNGATVILIENASRFARDLAVQLTGHDLLKAQGITLLPVDAPDYFTNETPTAVLVRQILGAISQFEKASLVQKLRQARERKRLTHGRCEGRPPV